MNSKFREEERWQLLKQIQEWNLNRLDLFALSDPNERLEFFGVMRFFYQDEGEKISTKCIRVSSTATTNDVIETLVEKFRPDMRMLTKAGYSLLEVHVNGEERKLQDHERPLIVQLNWGKDDREGRFLLRKEADKHSLGRLSSSTSELSTAGKDGRGSFKRKLSKREKKELKKKEKEEKMKGLASRGSDVPSEGGPEGGVAEKLYSELPESSFTRSISNPELVMRKRRQLKLEKKLQDMNNPNGMQGGILKIYGQSIKPDVPYKTLLLSITDTVAQVVIETLEKYGYEKEDPDKFCLVQVLIPPDESENSKDRRERIMEDDECPLNIFLQHPPSKDDGSFISDGSLPSSDWSIKFHLRLRPPDAPKKRRLQKNVGDHRRSRDMDGGNFSEDTWSNDSYQQLSFFLVPLAMDGRELNVERITVPLGMMEFGKEKMHPQNIPSLFLSAPEILPQHCTLNRSAGGATWIAPSNQEFAVVFVEGQRVYRPTQIFPGQVIQIGKSYFFRFVEDFPKQINKASTLQHYPQKQQLQQHPYANGGGVNINKKPTYAPPQHSANVLLPNRPPHNRSPSSSSSSTTRAKDFETTFDLDGQVLTMQGQGQYPSPKMNNKNNYNNSNIYNVGKRGLDSHINLPVNLSKTSSKPTEDLLPASFTYPDGYEDHLLKECISDVNFAAIQFKMSPAFLLYMAARSKLPSTMTTPNIMAVEQKIANMSMKVAQLVARSVQEHTTNPPLLAFWLANSSELTNFFRFDEPLSHLTNQAQVALMEVVQVAFSSFVECLKGELEQTLPSFINPGADGDDLAVVEDFVMKRQPPKLGNVTHVLSLAMSVLRKCRVNATITILIFSQLFRFINSWIFNCAILEKRLRLCTSEWGRKIRMRVKQVMQWAEKQGLELAAECHMTKILQLCRILECRKPDQLLQAAQTCDLINSLQMQAILINYIPLPNEPPLSKELVERAVRVAGGGGDLDGVEPQLPEPLDVHVTLVFPDEGFSCDSVVGIPPGLVDFVDGLVRSGHGAFNINSSSTGSWAVHLNRDLPIEDNIEKVPEVINITVNKIRNSLGLSILAAQGERQREMGIFVKYVLPRGAADLDGRIQAGDQLIEVGGKSLVGVTQEKAAEMMSQAGQVVDLVIMKGAAFYHGLSDRLELGAPLQSQQVPEMQQQNFHPSKNEVYGRYPDHLHPNDPYSNRQPHLINSTSTLDLPSNPQNRQIASSYYGREMTSSYSDPNLINVEEPYLAPVQVSKFQQRTTISTPNAAMPDNQSIKQQYGRIPVQTDISGGYVDQQLKNPTQHQFSDLYSTRKEVLYGQGPSGVNSTYAANLNSFPPNRDRLSFEKPGSTAYLGTANLLSSSGQFNDVPALKTTDKLPVNKMLRPSSGASNRGPGYAAQMLFPKAPQPSVSITAAPDARNSPVVFSQGSTINQNNLYLKNRPYSPAIPDQKKASNTDFLIQTVNQSSEINQGKSQILMKGQTSPGNLDFPPPPPDTQLAQLKILGAPQNNNQPRLHETGQPRPFDNIQNQDDSQYSSNTLKRPPPVAMKPKITPSDLKSVSLSKSPWEKEAREKEEEELSKRKRKDEIRRLECKPYLSQEEQLKLKKLQTEEEFDQRLQQANEEALDYDTLPKPPNLPKFTVATNGSSYTSEPTQFGSYLSNTKSNQLQPDQLTSGTVDYPSYKNKYEEKPSLNLQQPSITPAPIRLPGSSALKQQPTNSDSSQLSYPPPSSVGPAKKTVTFNEQVGVNEYPAHRSYGSTSSDGSLIQSFDQSSAGSDDQHSGLQEINGMQATYLPKFADKNRLVFDQPQIAYEVKPRFTPEPLLPQQLKTSEQHSGYPYKPTYPGASESSFSPSQQEQSSVSYPYRPPTETVRPSEPILGRNHVDSRNPHYGQRARTTGNNQHENLYASRGKRSYGNVN